MIERIQGIGIVSILAFILYLAGFLGHRSYHLSQSDDISVQGKGIWRYLLGVNGAEKIYLRPAFTQGIGILYFVLGVGGVLLFGMRIVKPLTIWVILGGLTVGGIVWIGIDIWKSIRT